MFPGYIQLSQPLGLHTLNNVILSTKVRLVKAMVFPVVMFGCESWILTVG